MLLLNSYLPGVLKMFIELKMVCEVLGLQLERDIWVFNSVNIGVYMLAWWGLVIPIFGLILYLPYLIFVGRIDLKIISIFCSISKFWLIVFIFTKASSSFWLASLIMCLISNKSARMVLDESVQLHWFIGNILDSLATFPN